MYDFAFGKAIEMKRDMITGECGRKTSLNHQTAAINVSSQSQGARFNAHTLFDFQNQLG